jgi:predicted nucleic acid-binding protein
MAKVVVNANVIISAAFGGKPLEAFVRALEDHEVYLSEAIAQELLGVVSGLSKKLSEDQLSFIQEKIQQLLTLATPISLSTHVVLSRDPKDDHYRQIQIYLAALIWKLVMLFMILYYRIPASFPVWHLSFTEHWLWRYSS